MIGKLNVIGLALVVVFVGVVGGWASNSEMAGAVIASGTVIVESVDKKVQHPTGGVIKEILVHDGSVVEEGQVVVRLDDTVPARPSASCAPNLTRTVRARARLLAEREDATRSRFPKNLLRAGTKPISTPRLAARRSSSNSRKAARAGLRAQLRERISQSNEEIRGLGAQLQAKENEIELRRARLVGVSRLLQEEPCQHFPLLQLQREQSRLQGERGQFIADIARARAKISETELQIIQLDQDFRTEVLKDLRETEGKIAELIDRIVAAEDQLKRIDIRAPRSGVVHSLSVHTIGGVIGNGEIIMSIVPRGDDLVVEAKVTPSDIDQIEPRGSDAGADQCRQPADDARS